MNISTGNKTKLGVVVGIASSVAAAWYGVEAACKWLVGRNLIVDEDDLVADQSIAIVANVNEKVEIMSISNNYNEWCKLMKQDIIEMQDPEFTSCRIHNRDDGYITIRIGNSEYEGLIDRNVDLTYNRVTRSRCQLNTNNNGYIERSLGHPIETRLTIHPDTRVIMHGMFNTNGVFHVHKISNYSVDQFKSVMGHRKASNVWIAGLGLLVIGAVGYISKSQFDQ